MEIKLDPVELAKKKLFIATPMYGGQCSGLYTKSMADLTSVCAKHGIPLRHYFLFNESLITRARNYCVDEFLRSDCTHLLFIDSDRLVKLLFASAANEAFESDLILF